MSHILNGNASDSDDSDRDNYMEFRKPKPCWSKFYVDYLVANFDVIFDRMYQAEIVEKVFKN